MVSHRNNIHKNLGMMQASINTNIGTLTHGQINAGVYIPLLTKMELIRVSKTDFFMQLTLIVAERSSK